MYPPILMLHVPNAAAVIQYRYLRTKGARAKAATYGHKGLQFPWESAFTGFEVQGSNGELCAL